MRIEHRYVKEGLYTPKDATSLLIGTFPSVLIREKFGRVRVTDVDFFYGSFDNNFWRDLGVIYGRDFSFNRTREAVEQRKALLADLKMAISDAVFACETTGSTMDAALEKVELNPYIIRVLDATPTINKLYFTSSSGKVNAETLTLRLLKEKRRIGDMKVVQKTAPRLRSFLYSDDKGEQRPMTSVTLYSPSPLAEQWGGLTAEKRQAQYEQYLPKIENEE